MGNATCYRNIILDMAHLPQAVRAFVNPSVSLSIVSALTETTLGNPIFLSGRGEKEGEEEPEEEGEMDRWKKLGPHVT